MIDLTSWATLVQCWSAPLTEGCIFQVDLLCARIPWRDQGPCIQIQFILALSTGLEEALRDSNCLPENFIVPFCDKFFLHLLIRIHSLVMISPEVLLSCSIQGDDGREHWIRGWSWNCHTLLCVHQIWRLTTGPWSSWYWSCLLRWIDGSEPRSTSWSPTASCCFYRGCCRETLEQLPMLMNMELIICRMAEAMLMESCACCLDVLAVAAGANHCVPIPNIAWSMGTNCGGCTQYRLLSSACWSWRSWRP